MTQRLALALTACFAGLLLAGCAAIGPSVETSDIFQAAPWQPGESSRYQVVNTAGEVIGTGILSSELDGDRVVLRQEYLELETAADATPNSDTTSVWVDASTFRPLEGERAIIRRDAGGGVSEERWEWHYTVEEGQPVLVSTHVEGSREPSERTLRLRDHYYDNESSLWLWRAVDLGEEHEEHYVSVNPLQRSQQTIHLRIPQTEVVVVPAGEFESYRLLFRTGRAVRTAWIEADAPHRILRWDNGEVILELMP